MFDDDLPEVDYFMFGETELSFASKAVENIIANARPQLQLGQLCDMKRDLDAALARMLHASDLLGKEIVERLGLTPDPKCEGCGVKGPLDDFAGHLLCPECKHSVLHEGWTR